MNSKNRIFRFVCLLTGLIIFIENGLPCFSYAQIPSPLPYAGITQSHVPLLMRGMKLDSADPLHFRFIVDTGSADLDQDELYRESEKLIKYFLTCLTVPEKDLWVNLSPVEHDRITSEVLSKTDLGRVLLSQDYLLKKMSASLMQPDSESGRRFWDEVYSRMYEQGQTAEIPSGIFHKIWITPESADLYAQGDFVLIMRSRLKVMLEEDYEAQSAKSRSEANGISSDIKSIIRQIIFPIIEKEVNEGETFAPLRQIFHALILAKWFKANFKTSFVYQVYANQSKIDGMSGSDPRMIEGIYADYLAAYRSENGFVQEEYDPAQGAIVARQYFSGGFEDNAQNYMNAARTKDFDGFKDSIAGDMAMINVGVQPVSRFQRRFAAVISALLSVFFLAWATPANGANKGVPIDHYYALDIPVGAGHWSTGFDPIEPDLAAEMEQRFLGSDFYQMLQSQDTVPAAVDTLKDIFSRYYTNVTALAEADINQSSDVEFYQTIDENILNEIRRLFNLADLDFTDESGWKLMVPTIQRELKKHGLYFVLRLHAGFIYEERLINHPCMEIVLAPIVSSEFRSNVAVGLESVSYTKLVLGSSLVAVPVYVPSSVELVDFNGALVLLPEAYRSFLNLYYEAYAVAREQFAPPYTQEGALWWKQWGTEADAMEREAFLDFAVGKVMEYYQRHGEQHLADRKAVKEGRLKFSNTFPEFSDETNQSAHMELRALLRQMIDGVLPYQALMDFTNYYILAAEYGDHSEYGLAGRIGYPVLNQTLEEFFLDDFFSKAGTLGDVAAGIRSAIFEKSGLAGFNSSQFEFMSDGLAFLTPEQIRQWGLAAEAKLYPDSFDEIKVGAGRPDQSPKKKKKKNDPAQLAQGFIPGGIALDTTQMNYAVRGAEVSEALLLSNSTDVGYISGLIPAHLKITILQNISFFTSSH